METIITRFMNDINHDNSYIIELHHYMEFEVMMQMTVKVKKQNKKVSFNRGNH